ncbi:hypothetical protein GCM10025771_01180 [Niveibacterium umoris]|uniref:Putative membrane protein n=1 Tax=Niveibacterium umoris TaxID=1193620 RepID=A0A840BSE8_9RHOO|nr:BPSS1780 family membrane protein [Niveibacterium umoris]MBB4014339.1 putative membrane protein [Niveibacterium umoris]
MHAHHIPVPASVPPSRALNWLREGWRLFMAHPASWAVMGAAAFVVIAIAVWLPFIGRVLAMVVLQILAGGMVAAARHSDETGTLKINELWDGLRRHAANLAMIGVLQGIALTATGILAMITSLLLGMILDVTGLAHFDWITFVVSWLVDLFVSFVVVMAMLLALWFAPALVMLNRASPFDAMRLSFRAAVHNPGASAVVGLCLVIGIPLVITMTFGFGIVVVIPLVATTIYASWRDVIGASPATVV